MVLETAGTGTGPLAFGTEESYIAHKVIWNSDSLTAHRCPVLKRDGKQATGTEKSLNWTTGILY
jgi:hypothetical protein